MTRRARRLTINDARRVNAMSAERHQRFDAKVHRLLRAATDSDRARRLSERQCLYCFYLPDSRLAGQAFTEWSCRYCDHVGSHPNTAVPRCCNACSDELGLCVDCGGTLDMQRVDKLRRQKFPAEPCERCGKRPPPTARVPFRFGIAAYHYLCVACADEVRTFLENEVMSCSDALDDHDVRAVAPRTGLLVFEGMIEHSLGPDPDVYWSGEWRPLTHWELLQVGCGQNPFGGES